MDNNNVTVNYFAPDVIEARFLHVVKGTPCFRADNATKDLKRKRFFLGVVEAFQLR